MKSGNKCTILRGVVTQKAIIWAAVAVKAWKPAVDNAFKFLLIP